MNQLSQNKNIDEIITILSGFLSKEVFYIPILGPVHYSNSLIKKFLFDVLRNSRTNRFLSYDGNKRWFPKKTEKIILSAIMANNQEIYIPVKDSFRNVLKIFYYSNNFVNDIVIKKAQKIYKAIKIAQKFDNSYLYCFKKPTVKIKFACHNIYLKNIISNDNLIKLSKGINYYNELPKKIQLTFRHIGNEPDLQGFDFLWKEFIVKNKKLNSIICATSKERIVGAIGPLDVIPDTWGVPFLLPPYFGVVKTSRRMGVGKKLWKAAMSFAYKEGAKYTLVQSISNSAAVRFYKKQRLSNMGKIYSCLLN